jgi:hypothetical protein
MIADRVIAKIAEKRGHGKRGAAANWDGRDSVREVIGLEC